VVFCFKFFEEEKNKMEHDKQENRQYRVRIWARDKELANFIVDEEDARDLSHILNTGFQPEQGTMLDHLILKEEEGTTGITIKELEFEKHIKKEAKFVLK
jgi:hypothetical protein